MQDNFSTIICIADVNITDLLDKTLADLALPEVFVQRAKQMFLIDKRGFLGLRPVTRHDESRALFFHFYVPSRFEHGVMRRIAEATDLRMGGRGCIFAQRGLIRRGAPLYFDEAKLEALCGSDDELQAEDYACICCTVSRGEGEALAAAVLELGLCVPIVFFGSGVGLRDKLGLLRITIPVEKEIIWFLVPRSDAELVEKTLIPRARFDVPGHGFLYKSFVHAPVVNLRVRQGKRVHAATMEQVIAAMDEVRGSSDWRRLGAKTDDLSGNSTETTGGMKGLFFIGEEEEVEIFRKTAMASGARGATLNHLEMRSYRAAAQDQIKESRSKERSSKESHSRELCDIIIPSDIERSILASLEETGLFAAGRSCILKILPLGRPASFRHV
ncbi:MAG: hypothetical protein LBP81_00755 [Treponema sp.]|jgi:hypothetical protein|nr:hypothetical protein [Treponema sp.]